MRRKLWLFVVAATGLCLIGALSTNWYRGRQADDWLQSAEESLANDDWAAARTYSNRLIKRGRYQDPARLILAEATIKDESLRRDKAVQDAVEALALVETERVPEARLREAELRLLLLGQPQRADELAREAIRLDSAMAEAYRLRWTILNATSRAQECAPVFWKLYEVAPENQRFALLRQWFVSEFARSNFNIPLDRGLLILGPEETPTLTTSMNRLLAFRNAEPERANNHAALASWFELQADAEQSFKLLQEASSLDDAWDSPLFVGCLVRTCFDLGATEEARSYFAKWPEPHDGYDYWRARGLIEQEIDHDYAAAFESYSKAASQWPGESDWTLCYRMATCADLNGDSDQAARLRARSDRIKNELHPSNVNALRVELGEGESVEIAKKLVAFYGALDRPREASAWKAFAN